MKKINFAEYYTKIIGIFFLTIIYTLIMHSINVGFTAESMHKIFHILLGTIVILNWKNKKFYKPFALVNGAFFSYVAIFGFLFPNFAGMVAFTMQNSIMHSVVGLGGLIVYFLDK